MLLGEGRVRVLSQKCEIIVTRQCAYYKCTIPINIVRKYQCRFFFWGGGRKIIMLVWRGGGDRHTPTPSRSVHWCKPHHDQSLCKKKNKGKGQNQLNF